MEKLEKVIDDFQVEAVIHFAAFTSVPESVAKPDTYFQNNSVNTLGLLNLMRSKGINQFIFSSTAATYGEPVEVPITESHQNVQTNPYGHSKRFTEIMLESYDQAFGLKYVALRYFNACGGALVEVKIIPRKHI